MERMFACVLACLLACLLAGGKVIDGAKIIDSVNLMDGAMCQVIKVTLLENPYSLLLYSTCSAYVLAQSES